MSREKIEKLVLVGFDGLMFEMVERFTAEGRLPNMKRLIAEGCWGRMNPCLPCDTPTNWTSIATGAATGTSASPLAEPLGKRTRAEQADGEQDLKGAEACKP